MFFINLIVETKCFLENEMKKIIFDTETTGLLAPKLAPLHRQPYMTEIYAVKVDNDFNILGEINQLIKVPVKVSKLITKLTGIDDKMLEDQPTFEDFALELKIFFEDADEMIAHNLPFDKSILQFQYDRAEMDINFPLKQTCTIQKSMSLTGRRMSLQNLHKKLLGQGFADAHRAKNDVMALVRVYHNMLGKGML